MCATRDNLLGRAPGMDLFFEIRKRFREKQWRDVVEEEMIEPDRFVYAQGLKKGLIEDKNWTCWHRGMILV
ncbi:MAG TPA: hypothetical protein VGW37_03855 [Terriglobia bacterium]|nr:hypothetical protein [Terriglobia bacterium]